MSYTLTEKQAIASFIRCIILENNGLSEDEKMCLLDILPRIGITEDEFKTTHFLNKNDSLFAIQKFTKGKRLELLMKALQLAGFLNRKYISDFNQGHKEIAAFYFVFENASFWKDITIKDMDDIDIFYSSTWNVVKFNYWKLFGQNRI